jgi:putative flippase GtrA
MIGAVGAGVDFGVYTLIVVLTGAGHYQAANAAGYASGIVVSFTANATLNFCTRDRLAARFLTFCGTALLGWMTAALLLELLVGRMSWNVYVAKFATLTGVVLIQYSLNRRFTFRKIN